MKNIVAVIPVHGRRSLVKYTIERLLKKNGCSAVICVGDNAEDQITCTKAGAMWVQFANQPLGAKWNAGFVAARNLAPDGVLFVGSSDWVSDNWLSMADLLDKYDLIGKPDFYLLDISNGNKRMCHWPGYTGPREGEPIGIGRIISARVLEKIGWKPFDDYAIKSMDHTMYKKIEEHGKICCVELGKYKSLSISTNAWPNMHKFEDHWNGKLESTVIENVDEFLEAFPEAHELNLKPEVEPIHLVRPSKLTKRR